MRHPLWIVNSTLLLFLALVGTFVYLSRIKPPRRSPIEPEAYERPKKKFAVETINIKKIYEDDLFGTFQREVPVYKEPQYDVTIPAPPQPQPVIVPEVPKPTFLDPLDITLKGIIVVGHDESKNRIIVSDNKTDRESTYKVGDAIEDAQLIRIFNNKIILLRSNGQQEVLYLREQDALLDPAYALLAQWDSIIERTGAETFTVAPTPFVKRVQNLAQFIDMLSLTTAYQQGVSVGCRVGPIQEGSLGAHFGLQTGDIITHVHDIPATTTAERLRIYKALTTMQDGDQFTIAASRRGQPFVMHIKLKDRVEEKQVGVPVTPSPEQDLARRKEMLQQKHKFAPTLHELHKQEQQLMLEHGRIPKS